MVTPRQSSTLSRLCGVDGASPAPARLALAPACRDARPPPLRGAVPPPLTTAALPLVLPCPLLNGGLLLAILVLGVSCLVYIYILN